MAKKGSGGFQGKKAAPFTSSGRKQTHPHTAKGTPRQRPTKK